MAIYIIHRELEHLTAFLLSWLQVARSATHTSVDEDRRECNFAGQLHPCDSCQTALHQRATVSVHGSGTLRQGDRRPVHKLWQAGDLIEILMGLIGGTRVTRLGWIKSGYGRSCQ